jgi:beta-glucosidase
MGLSDGSAKFPPLSALRRDFTWGVSTSAFQIEGATQADGRGLSIWDIKCQRGEIANGDTADVACDHYHRYPEDIALMKQLGLQAYRFSVGWPRVLPQGRGQANEPGLAFYDRLIDGLLAAGIEPWLCLYHWDLPQPLEELGGWRTRDSVSWFADYALLVARRYGDRVKRFATFNEPSIFTLFGHRFGAASGVDKMHAAIHHVNLAHGAAVDALRQNVPGSSIGSIHNYQACLPSKPADAQAAELCAAYWNRVFPDPQYRGEYPPLLRAGMEQQMQPGDMARIHRPLDWFGLNHYGPTYIAVDTNAPLGFSFGEGPEGVPETPIGWPMDANSFRDILLTVAHDYKRPVYVLENGLGSDETPDVTSAVADGNRIDYLRAYIGAMNQAVAAGADIRGYFVWSLLDNFEWDSGLNVRFGLTYVDYTTLQRTPKSSFYWYRDLIAAARQAGP